MLSLPLAMGMGRAVGPTTQITNLPTSLSLNKTSTPVGTIVSTAIDARSVPTGKRLYTRSTNTAVAWPETDSGRVVEFGTGSANIITTTVDPLLNDPVPIHNPATQVKLLQSREGAYRLGDAGFTDAQDDGWRSAYGAVQDTTTNPAGANLIGVDPDGQQFFDLGYDAITNAGPQEGHAFANGAYTDHGIGGRFGHRIYMSMEYRFVLYPDYQFDLVGFPNIEATSLPAIKFQQFWSASGRHIENGIAYQNQPRSNSQAHLLAASSRAAFGIHNGTDTGDTALWARQAGGPFPYERYGRWTQFASAYMSQSAPGAHDGDARIWHHGRLVAAATNRHVGVSVPGSIPWVNDHFCESDDLDMAVDTEASDHLNLGGIAGIYLMKVRFQFRKVLVWRD